MDTFEELLEKERVSVGRFVKFRIPVQEDAEDVLQEVFLTAYQKFSQLKNRSAFKAWLLSIARNKCNDYFRRKAGQYEIPLDMLSEKETADGRYGITEEVNIKETISLLGDKDRQILYLFFWKEMPQADIARKLGIPLGTVKSRLHTAKQNFKEKYSYRTGKKGEKIMKKLPEQMPEYRIEASTEPVFSVKWEELMGWFLVPRLGEKISWGMYDMPSGKCIHVYDMEAVGRAKVHGIEGVELIAREAPYSSKKETIQRTFIAQLTDTHCRYLATIRTDDGIRNYITFLDGDEFMLNWGFGEDNCGNETNLAPKGEILRAGSVITAANQDFLLDIVGRYTVSIQGKKFDTVCVMDLSAGSVITEQYLDHDGKTILWRRFNRDDWALDRYKRKWSEQLPENERLTVNGDTFVHWYDCITDYIL
ncbi:MAG: RNA polymerase sigma factor [Lachnospirales bacterium]